MIEVVYLTDHGTYKKGDERTLPESTAKALAVHKVVEIKSEKKTKAK